MKTSRGSISGVSPTATIPVRELAANARPGDTVGITYRVFLRGKLIASASPATRLVQDATVRLKLNGFRPAKRSTYVVRIEANTVNGGRANRELTVVAV